MLGFVNFRAVSSMRRRLQGGLARSASESCASLCSLLFFGICISCYGSVVASADEPGNAATDAWIRGSLEDLELRLHGEVLDFDGQPAEGAVVEVIFRNQSATEKIEADVEGNRFEVWLPAYRTDWHALIVRASSNDGIRFDSALYSRPAVRQLAVKGLDLRLSPPVRTVNVNVVHDGQPVPGASVKVETSSRGDLEFQADAQGTLRVGLLPKERINSFTAWTDKPLFGGFQFGRQPVRDENAASQTIELFACREQTFRVVDQDGNPCADVKMHLQVATPPPNYNYLGELAESHMTTDDVGEAKFRWFPDWDEVHCYVDLDSKDWVIDGKAKWVGGDFVVQVKPAKQRSRVFGKLEVESGSPAGYCVFWRSFQGEQEGRSDFATSVTDEAGRFAADLLPDATYCVFINDTVDVSDMVDLIPAPSDGTEPEQAVVRMQEAASVSVLVTAGEQNRPIPNQAVYVRQTHSYQWLEDGDNRSGSSARDRYIYTDENGMAEAAVEVGKEVELSIYNPDWRTSKELPVLAEKENKAVLHRELDKPRTVFGFLQQDDENPVPVEEIRLIAGAVDGETRGTQEVTAQKNGIFRFETQAISVGVFATSEDGTMAGAVVDKNPQRILRLSLQPTQTLSGRLVDQAGKPVVGRSVSAEIRVMLKSKEREVGFRGFRLPARKVLTDEAGVYEFKGMPIGLDIALSAEAKVSVDSHWLGIFELEAGKPTEVKEYVVVD